jgi:hypothetical protein
LCRLTASGDRRWLVLQPPITRFLLRVLHVPPDPLTAWLCITRPGRPS